MPGRRVLLGWLQTLVGAAVLAVLVWKLGSGPFIDGIMAVDARAVAAAVVITLGTTLCCAWRWQLVARGLGQYLPFWPAVAAYYRSQFLNSVLPGGILGDVHRGVDQGSRDGDVGGGLRAVAWDRAAGQGVQLVLAVLVLWLLPSPLHRFVAVLAWVLLALAAALSALVLWPPRSGAQWWARVLPAVASDLRHGLLTRRAAPGIVLASTGAVAGHTAIFLIAAGAAGTAATAAQLLPLAMLVLLAMSVPASIAGWGPREGAAAWAFMAAGLGAAQGVSAAVVYGVLALAACLPGAVVLLVAWLHRDRHLIPMRRGQGTPGGVRHG
ncbi:lysylphosphatidylglycerol synthase domain-containing protein [Arthrobacter alpinus]|uniref:lysylphosphatidylglycerol synthase domain-containing protein n=1 Tax=Arthrobacter alpinus TaxID=656366 RepID=UPI0009F84703|nr:lysylphosphatidylglycerol synthase domain-containing protein [Arthrobacter alpinus]